MKVGLGLGLIVLAAGFCTSPAFGQMTVVNGASFDSAQPMAPGSFASILDQNLCAPTMAGDWIAVSDADAAREDQLAARRDLEQRVVGQVRPWSVGAQRQFRTRRSLSESFTRARVAIFRVAAFLHTPAFTDSRTFAAV